MEWWWEEEEVQHDQLVVCWEEGGGVRERRCFFCVPPIYRLIEDFVFSFFPRYLPVLERKNPSVTTFLKGQQWPRLSRKERKALKVEHRCSKQEMQNRGGTTVPVVERGTADRMLPGKARGGHCTGAIVAGRRGTVWVAC